jgi:hypothetical protein
MEGAEGRKMLTTEQITTIREGAIRIDTKSAKLLGFTSDKFEAYSYLWRTGKTITISLIAAKRKGAFRGLIETILANGYDFEIPTPSKRMRQIGARQKWIYCQKDSEFGPVEILTNRAPTTSSPVS